MKLHNDWPEFDPAERRDYTNPHSELVNAFQAAPMFASAVPISHQIDGFAWDEIATIDRYYIDSNGMGGDGGVWSPGKEIATELTMILVGTLRDGRYFTLAAWNDYTGWGCQDGCDIRVGATLDDVLSYGLSDSDRERLGL